jgi:hypothetical protein
VELELDKHVVVVAVVDEGHAAVRERRAVEAEDGDG